MANVLIVHQNFPGQFPHIADALRARGDKVAAIGGKTARPRPGVDFRRWSATRGTTKGIFEPATRAEADMIRGIAAIQAASQLKQDGFTPDVIVGHPGWGETIFLKEIWPEARIILFGEMLYRSHGGDLNFDPEFGADELGRNMRAHAKNASQVLAFAYADRIVCPTPFQAASFPPGLRPMIRVIHEGVDVSHATRRPDARIKLPDGRMLDRQTPVISFVNRTFEPLRGFHVFMRALPDFLAACPEAEVLMIGQPALAGYGGQSPNGKDWKSWILDELGDRLDPSRVHWMGKVPHGVLIDAFSIARAHVYYTYPFVLSWSLVEAMATEVPIIASDTGPVRDAITDGVEGVLLPFFDVAALSAALTRAVREPEAFAGMGQAARSRALADYDQQSGTAAWLALIDELAGG
ncbi:MAG TPA: glycosyltransferase [Sphingomonas sp.]|uniref:glycosyltransferase n=1 Tax=Sphingomonas sp. TaxID=28214 RepID=UPI002B541377|nr:glycosyltransferase [Sphingomonas sp.]HMI20282.1 glycosyltransferase [Sphingomonas sp.]